MKHLSDELRTTGRPLSALIREMASWTPVWTSWSTSSSSEHVDYSRLPPLGGGAGKEKDLQSELDKTRKWASNIQSERDRLANELRNVKARSRSRGRGGGGGGANGRNNKGNNGDKGEGKGHGKRH